MKAFYFKLFLITAVVLTAFQKASSQTITTAGVSATNFCSYTSVAINVAYNRTGTFNAGNIFTAQLSDATGAFGSPVNIGTLSSTGNGTIAANIPAGTASGNAYKIRVVSSNPVVIGSLTPATLTITLPTGNPSVFGNGVWNAYAYNGNNYNTYYGLYTENNINFSSITRWDQNGTPSSADASSGSAYAGCIVPGDNHSVSYKRTNFTCGLYQIDITGNDDAASMLIDGVTVWSRAFASGALVTNAWTGYLEPTSTVEFRWQENAGQSYGRLNINASTATPTALLTTAGTNCTSFTANWTVVNNSSTYFIDVATDAAFTSILPGYNNLNTGNVTSQLVSGLTVGTEYFYRVRASHSTCGLTTGNSNVISNQIALTPTAPLTICQGESVTLTASNSSNYTWSPATGLSATNTAVVIASPAVTTTYTVTSTDALSCSNSKSVTINVNPTSGTPSVFGNGVWNAYAYNGNNFNQYYGTYSENNLSFNSTTRWAAGLSPSSADATSGNAYAGCPVPVDQHSVSYKRTNFACGLYQIDISNHDDDAALFVDGVQVWIHNGCCDAHANVWKGFLNASSTVEFRWREYGGNSLGSVSLNPIAIPTTLMASPGANCTEMTANWGTVVNTSNYFLDVATDAAFTAILPGYNNLNVGNVTAYLVTGLTPGTIYYYRVRAYNTGCNLLSGNSNTMTTQVQVSTSAVTICDGGSAVLTASNAATYSWSPATGLSATTGATVTASPISNTIYTVTGTTAGGCTSTNTITVTADTIGNPNTFGNGFWNVYCYNNNFTTYRGMYTETALSFNSTTRWASNGTPSNAGSSTGLPYAGCPVGNDNHGVSYKRTNFTCGIYQINVPAHDDDAFLFINGVQVWVHNGCCDAHTNVWTGFLGPTSTVEFRWQDSGGGNSNATVSFSNVTTIPTAIVASAGTNSCVNFNARWNAYGGTTNYLLDVSTSNTFASFVAGYNGLDVGNVTTYEVTGLNNGTIYYYRVRANNTPCNLTTNNSNTISYTTSSVPGTPGTFASGGTVCQGQNNVTYTVNAPSGAGAVYTWSYSGTGATITGTSNSVTITYATNATSGTLSVNANNTCGAGAARTLNVTVNPLPSQPGAFSAGSASVCTGQTVAYTVGAATSATSYSWSYTGGTGATVTGTTVNASVVYSASATSGTLNVVGNNACGSSVTARTLSITVNPTPSVTASSNAPVCHGTSLNLSATTIATASYSWTGPNSFTSSSQNPSLTYATAAAGTYTVTATLGTCSSPSSTVVASSTPGLWVGTTSTDWNTTTNWCTYALPVTTTDVIVPSVVNMPLISGATANVRALTINASAVLTKAPTGTLNVYGNFTNNGTFTDNGIYTHTGSVIFRGGTAQSINGATVFNNLTINNTNGVMLNSTTTVNGILTLTAGTFATNGNLNQNLYDGAIAGTGTGTTTGSIRFFKTIWGDKYHYLSSPISGSTVSEWNDNVTMKFGPTAYNLYTYDETVPDTNKLVGWTTVTSNATTLQNMTGYALYFPRYTFNTLLDMNGAYTHGATFSKSLTKTNSTTPFNKPASDGWNFVGNPYPSTIDWKAATGWTKTNIDDAIYTWDGRTNKYVSFVNNVGSNGGTRYIGSMQGFFVKVTTASTGTLAMTNSVRTTSILYDVWRTEEEEIGDIFRLTATSGEFSDETVIRFKEDATPAFDVHLDAYKLLNGGSSPSLYSISGDVDYSINSLPNNVVEKTIPLSIITGFAGRYSFTADFSQFKGEQSLWLEDKLLGTLQNLREDNVYSVNIEKGSVEGRFFIQYRNQEAGTVTGNTGQSASAGIEITSYFQTVSILFPSSNGKANITVLDALGKKVYEENNTDFSSGKINIQLPSAETGIYIVKVQTSATLKTQQVLIQK